MTRDVLRSLLIVEIGLCFVPAILGMVFWLTGFVAFFGSEHFSWRAQMEPALALLAGGAGLIGASVMFVYILSGRRMMNRTAMFICLLAGLLLAARGTQVLFDSDEPMFFRLFFLAPFLGGLQLYYLGRSYFSAANKTMEPTR
jgi:hypothetical protein